MSNNNERIKTNIKGLDELLKDGFRKKEGKGLLIVIEGGSGVRKVELAIDIMLGITTDDYLCKINDGCSSMFQCNYLKKHSLFYTTNKGKTDLELLCKGMFLYKCFDKIKIGHKDKNLLVSNIKSLFKRSCNQFDDNLNNIYFNSQTFAFYKKGEYDEDSALASIDYKKIKIPCDFNNGIAQNDNDYTTNDDLVHFNNIFKQIDGLKNGESRCIVIDGFSHFSDEELNRLQWSALEHNLREKAEVSILIFDKRFEKLNISSDVVIEMRKTERDDLNYTYHELSIKKILFQRAAHGWHEYKLYGGGINVFPSVHKVLSEKSNIYEKFIMSWNDNMADDIKILNDNKINSSEKDPEKYLKNVLWPTIQRNSDNNDDKRIKQPVTALIGNKNTFKRYIAAASVVHTLEQNKKDHALILMMNENKLGIENLIQSHTTNEEIQKRIHFWELERIGCISPAELLYTLERFEELYSPKKDGSMLHVYLIDLGAIDYCFPMLKLEKLFIPALTTVCRDNNMPLTILCNKKFSDIDALCTLADKVICLERDIKYDCNSLRLRLEKNTFGPECNSRVYQYDINDITNLFENKDGAIQINNNAYTQTEISTNKDYWRRKAAVYTNDYNMPPFEQTQS